MRCRDNISKHCKNSTSLMQSKLLSFFFFNFTQSRATWKKENRIDGLFQSDALYPCL